MVTIDWIRADIKRPTAGTPSINFFSFSTMPKSASIGQRRRTAARFTPTSTESVGAVLPVPAGATRLAVIEYTDADTGRRAYVTHDHVPELADAEVVRQLRELAPQSESERGKLYGKEWNSGERRRTLQVSDTGAAYRYSGSAWQGRPVRRFAEVPVVARVRDAVERATGVRFNFVLLNFYNEEGALGWHQDDEVGHVAGAPIASASVCGGSAPLRPGETKTWAFDLRVKDTPAKKWRVAIGNGDLVVMGGACQQLLQHCVPGLKRDAGDWRINLTFRQFAQ